MNTLILTVGLPRSGKSTWARGTGLPVVNPDSIRLALHGERFIALAEPMVWATAGIMVRALFLAGHTSVILDATNTTEKRRNQWYTGEWNVRYKEFPVTADECIARAAATQDEYIKPVIERMAASFEPLTAVERERGTS